MQPSWLSRQLLRPSWARLPAGHLPLGLRGLRTKAIRPGPVPLNAHAGLRARIFRRVPRELVLTPDPSKTQRVTEWLREAGFRHSKAIGFTGYVLLTCQWCMDDVLLLRCFGVACATSMAIFLYCQPVPLMVPVRFNLLFIAINGIYIGRILGERRDLKLDDVEQMLWDAGFNAFLTKVELRDVLAIGRRITAEPGMVIAQCDMPVQKKVIALAKGGIEQMRGGKVIASFEPGDFWGEFQLVEKNRNTGARHKLTTVFSEKSVAVEWDAGELSEYLSKRPVVRQKLQELWAEGLNLKLDRRNADANERAYVDILRGILCNGTVGETEYAFLKHVRQVQKIPDSCHIEALHELGYSEKEFVDLVHQGRRPWIVRWLNIGFKPEPKRPLMKPAILMPDKPSARRWLDLDVHVSARSETGWSDSPIRRSNHSPWSQETRSPSAKSDRLERTPRRTSSLPPAAVRKIIPEGAEEETDSMRSSSRPRSPSFEEPAAERSPPPNRPKAFTTHLVIEEPLSPATSGRRALAQQEVWAF
eukprot:TRINITY_DN37672_c0_g1_i2.p1 TRINITY_DN37672_c0_g1~~TRINITY_DN37672_c0_g1_i2.p1  ORF type:complete len:531 (-),score=82.23 TRINITY_DN37672_c0_g1_i2:124-1716(-)